MAFLSVNKNKLHIQVAVGALEQYIPDEEIEAIVQDLESLRGLVKYTLLKIVGEFDNQTQAYQVLQQEPEKMKKWTDFLKNDFDKNFKKIQSKIDKKNQQICPNYSDIFEKKKEK